MAHVRQQVRDAATAILSGSVAGLWRHVFQTRIKPTRDVTPYLMVYAESEDAANLGKLTRRDLDRRIDITVRAFIKVTDDEAIEDAADDVAVEVENLLTFAALDAQLGGKLQGLQLESTSMEIETDETERKEAALDMQFEVRIFSVEGLPETLV